MLLQIDPVATGENAAIQLHRSDDVAIARVALSPGQELEIAGRSVTTRGMVPAGHKVAVHDFNIGDLVRRYGTVIGQASTAVRAGEHVHVHNLALAQSEHVFNWRQPAPWPKETTRTFQGYRREDGRTGTRNYIAVVSASNCAAHAAELIERSFAHQALPPGIDGVVSFPHGDGCASTIGPDTRQLQRTLEGVLDHPNVGAAMILGLGCEVNQIDHYLGASATNRSERLLGFTLQESGGTSHAVERARNELEPVISRVAAIQRTSCPASELILGLNCGGSDSFSGITANPALGYCSDLLVSQGGTVVLAETPEIFGAEYSLAEHARDRATGERLLECVEGYKAYLRQFGGNFDDNPSPGNKEGGLTNIVEKSLGAAAKAGSSPLEGVLEYAERIAAHGFLFMNTPGYDPVSLAGLAAGGVNLIAFTTGRGSAIGFGTIPVLKISSNSNTYRRMTENMDIDAGTVASGSGTVQAVGEQIFESLLRVASGERTKAELLGHHEFVPWKIGPVL